MTTIRDAQAEISAWGRATFGKEGVPAPADKIARRMNVEVAELLVGFDKLEGLPPGQARIDCLKDLGMECADIGIMLVQVSDAIGQDLQINMSEKMEINRNRTWARTASGKVQHVTDVAGYEEAMADVRRLTRELDVALNGPDSAAPQASLCDLLGQVLKERIRSPQWKPTRPAGLKSFKEPGSGLWMEPDLYYILSDSGSYYRGTGFATAEEAQAWAKSPEGVEAGAGEAVVPHFVNWNIGWQGSDGVNILKGDHLYLWWAAQGDEVLETNEEQTA